MRLSAPAPLAAALLVGIAAAACGDRTGLMEPEAAQLAASTGATLLECPTSETRTVTDTLGLLGGTVSLDGHSITLPYGAVLVPTVLTLTVPASNYMEIGIHANDLDSFEFLEPVSIAISYSRCTRSNVEHSALTAWHIDPDTHALLEHMGGTDDKTARIVRFDSGHLSGFAIAN